MEGSTSLLASLIADAQTLLQGFITGAGNIITFLIGNELTRLFLALTLVIMIIAFVKHFVRARGRM